MPFTMQDFCDLRPYLYHLTASENLSWIKCDRALLSASELFRLANRFDLDAVRRKEHYLININREKVYIRDQKPLHVGCIDFKDGWSFEDLIRSLNQRIYFWPGYETKPIKSGISHYNRYKDERPKILRISTKELLKLNADNPPLFCKYNSGAPRCNKGNKIPRGATTFCKLNEVCFTAGKVVEVTFLKRIRLPLKFEISDSPNGPWNES